MAFTAVSISVIEIKVTILSEVSIKLWVGENTALVLIKQEITLSRSQPSIYRTLASAAYWEDIVSWYHSTISTDTFNQTRDRILMRSYSHEIVFTTTLQWV